MCENAKLCIVLKMVLVFVKKLKTSHSFMIEKNYIIKFVDAVMLKKKLGIVFPIDICTRHRMSYKNVDLNICAHTYGP